jgi:hypothetical protein
MSPPDGFLVALVVLLACVAVRRLVGTRRGRWAVLSTARPVSEAETADILRLACCVTRTAAYGQPLRTGRRLLRSSPENSSSGRVNA